MRKAITQRPTSEYFNLYQLVIIPLAVHIVQWEASILVKLLVIVPGAFVFSQSIYVLLVKRVKLIRACLA
jgi:uncharacterized membrane protein YgdD (TMEM256/DUF423 family)